MITKFHEIPDENVNGNFDTIFDFLRNLLPAWTALGTATGTLTNAPKTGNPDKYFIVTHDGIKYAVPGWRIS